MPIRFLFLPFKGAFEFVLVPSEGGAPPTSTAGEPIGLLLALTKAD